ncbi:MAG: hypothetical protein ABIZ49_00230 [Opitutaceae bacterium]
MSVLRLLRNLCHRPAIRSGLRRGSGGRFAAPQFASFMAQNAHRRLDTDRHDAVLRGRKIVRHLIQLALVGGGAWVVLESARALSMF